MLNRKTTVDTNEEVENGAMKHGMKKVYFTSTTLHRQNSLVDNYLLKYKLKDFPFPKNRNFNWLWGETLKGYASKLEIYSVR